ncbi:MAG: ParB N-terminal domain-containing protein [Desulfobacterota bacterium]|nr:ParB N-terminal domain-containing protein [Thermodesulfobacteriota bacterium]
MNDKENSPILQGNFTQAGALVVKAEAVILDVNAVDLQDTSVSVTAGRETGALEASIRTIGVLNPPLLARKREGEGYRVVCGMLRMKAVAACGATSFRAQVAAADTDEQVLVLASLADNVPHRVFNPVEHARAAALLAGTFPDHMALRVWNELLGMPRAYAVFDQYRKIAGAGETVHALMLQGSITVDTAFALVRMAHEDRACFCDLFSQLHFSARKQAEILEYCDDISRRDGITLHEVLERSGVLKALRCDMHGKDGQRAEQIRRSIKLLRFPRLAAKERSVHELIRSMKLPPTITFEPPPFFEGDTWRLNVRVTSDRDMRDAAARLAEIAEHPGLKKLLEE